MSNLQIPSHLILIQKQKEQLYSLSASEFTNVKWESQDNAICFLKEHNLILESIQPEHKWKTCYSNKVKGIYLLQCCCDSDMSLKKIPIQKQNLENQDKYIALLNVLLLHILRKIKIIIM